MQSQFPPMPNLRQQQPEPHEDALTLTEVKAACEHLEVMGHAPLPLDQNNRATWLECPVRYRQWKRCFCRILTTSMHQIHAVVSLGHDAGLQNRSAASCGPVGCKRKTILPSCIRPKHKDPLKNPDPLCHVIFILRRSACVQQDRV